MPSTLGAHRVAGCRPCLLQPQQPVPARAGPGEAVHRIEIGTLPEGWQVGTAMRRVQGGYEATGYDELVDHPFEIGPWRAVDFDATGVPARDRAGRRLAECRSGAPRADVQCSICAAQIGFWGVAPFERYQFQLWTVDDGHGGLEHRASTALIAARRDLPTAIEVRPRRAMGTCLLGLFSHEYFHAWNVKRLRPAEFARFDYQRGRTRPSCCGSSRASRPTTTT